MSILKTTIIKPAGGLHSLNEVLRSVRHEWPVTRSLAWQLFTRDVRAMFRQSIFGYLWLIITPLANTMVWVYLNSQKIINIDTGDVPYATYALTGNLLWSAFSMMAIGMLTTLTQNRAILSKINFPQEALLISAFGKAALNGIIPLTLLLPVLYFLDSSISINWFWFLSGTFSLLLLGSTLSMLLLPIASLFDDIARGMPHVLRIMFFITPVVYPLPTAGIAKIVAELNPVTPLLVTARSSLLGQPLPLGNTPLIIMGICGLLLLVGLMIYKITLPQIIERISA